MRHQQYYERGATQDNVEVKMREFNAITNEFLNRDDKKEQE